LSDLVESGSEGLSDQKISVSTSKPRCKLEIQNPTAIFERIVAIPPMGQLRHRLDPGKRKGRATESHQVQSLDRQLTDIPQLQEHDAGVEGIAG
jgi:hypothetical protein